MEINPTPSRAEALLGEALRRAPEASACRAGMNGSPSRLAQTLIEMIEREDAHCEHKLAPAEYVQLLETAPEARWYRAVYRLSDGSVIAVHDGGAECAANEDFVLRHPSGHFAGVWDGTDPHGLARVFSGAVERLPRMDGAFGAEDLAKNLRGGTLSRPRYPLEDICGLVHVDSVDGTAVVATTHGVMIVPGNAPEIREVLDRANACMSMMEGRLGIPKGELESEVADAARIFKAAFLAFEQGRARPLNDPTNEFGGGF